jgi:uncharacterized protein YdaU (DUF1376 family)
MHYYSFNVADYRKDTHHLEPMEHYIYRFLMDSYYLNERPIPKETQTVMRRLRLATEHLKYLENVLNDFFTLADDGWHHGRIDLEISEYHGKCQTNAINGKKGGRSKKQGLTDENKPKKTQSVNFANRNESELKPNQEPLTNNQEPLTNNQEPLTNNQEPIKKKPAHSALAATLDVDIDLINRIVKHRADLKHPANTDKKITLVLNGLRDCVNLGLFDDLNAAMDYLDNTEWRTLKPE